MLITPSPPGQAKGQSSNMGQFSVEKPVTPGSALSGNQQLADQRYDNAYLFGAICPFAASEQHWRFPMPTPT